MDNQPKDVQKEVDVAMGRVAELVKDAWRDGYAAGYHKGFEFGVATVLQRGGERPQLVDTYLTKKN